jgi:hypothetical protein
MKFFGLLFSIFCFSAAAQFPGPAGTPGSTAMHADSSAFSGWASQCKITRGYQDISNVTLGYTTVGDSSMATGKAGTNGVVSLGDGGIAILTFIAPITNGPGFDFAVFENSFSDSFLELAFVEVSSNGVNFFRFPATSNSPASPQYDNNANMDASLLDNLAGKYRALYGTPFDLQELSGIAQLDILNITHVKVIDVVGSVNVSYASYDKNNNIINDPWPTPFPSSGFDLDAVGVIHHAVGIKEYINTYEFAIYPNPCQNRFQVWSATSGEFSLIIKDVLGNEISKRRCSSLEAVDISELAAGTYILEMSYNNKFETKKLIKR